MAWVAETTQELEAVTMERRPRDCRSVAPMHEHVAPCRVHHLLAAPPQGSDRSWRLRRAAEKLKEPTWQIRAIFWHGSGSLAMQPGLSKSFTYEATMKTGTWPNTPATRPEYLLPDTVDQTEIDGVVVREGTIEAFLKNAMRWSDPATSYIDRDVLGTKSQCRCQLFAR